MNYRAVVLSSIIVLFPVAASASDSPDLEELQRLMGEGKRYLDNGDLQGALSAFEAAESVELFELPNYEPLLWIADVRCRLGDTRGGLAVLADFECSLDVDSGSKPCYVGWETSTAPGQPNPDLSSRCYLEMCGEILLEYYVEPSEERLSWIGEFRERVSRVRSICVSGDEERSE